MVFVVIALLIILCVQLLSSVYMNFECSYASIVFEPFEILMMRQKC